MKMKNLIQLLSATGLALFSTFAVADNDVAVYGKAGLTGLGVGASYGVSDNFTVRGDFSTIGHISRDFHHREFDFDAKLKSDKLNLHADYFPFQNAFRLTTGLGFGRSQLTATGYSDNKTNTSFTIDGKKYEVAIDGNDTVNAKTKYPAVSPYFGIGYGHDVKRQKAGQWGFTADLGFYAGKPKTTVALSSSIYDKLVQIEQDSGADLATARAIIDQRVANETNKIKDKTNRLKVIPALNVGVSYHF